MHLHRTLLAILTILMVLPGISGQAGAYSNPPTWMPMEMLNVTYDSISRKLAVEKPAAPAQLEFQPAGTYDPAAIWKVLNDSATSRRLGWYDPGYDYINPATMVISSIRNDYGPGAYLWIESVTASPGLATYLAVGTYGVNSNDTPTVDNSNPTGIPYSPIFGTEGSSTKWQWDGLMDHNTYAVPAAFLNGPNQIFSATYRIYIGDSNGNELLIDKLGNQVASSTTTTTWQWQGPSFVFTSKTGAALNTVIESDMLTVAGLASPQPITVTGGEYCVSADGVTWSPWTTAAGTVAAGDRVKVRVMSSANPSATTTAALTVGGVAGPGTFSVTTIDGTPDPVAFTSLTGVDPGTSYESNPVTVTGIDAPVAISITGGKYAVSTDDGSSWSAWSSSVGTVSSGNKVKLQVTSSATANTAATTTVTIGGTTGTFTVTTNAYNAPPTWMPMTMLDVTLTNGTLSIVDLSTKAPFNTTPASYPVLSVVAAAEKFDPAKPWRVLNGAAYSRQLGFNPGAGLNGAAIQSAFGANAAIWIEKIDSSVGLQTYQAIGKYGVNADGTTTVDQNASGYAPIFGTGGSPTRWLWDYKMDHNTYAVPAAYLTEPNQHFSATYRLYIGDENGNDIAPAAATTTTWGWTGPATVPSKNPDAFSFTSLNAVAVGTVVESNTVTITGNAFPCIVSIDGGEYAISTDNGATWSPWLSAWTLVPVEVAAGDQVKVRLTSSPLEGTTTTATLYVCGASASFQVTTADTVPEAFTFTPVTGAATSFATPSEVITVTGITGDVPIAISGGTSPQFTVSTDGGTTWSAWSATAPATVTAGTKIKVRVTSSPLPFTATATTLNIGGVTASFSVTTGYINPPSWMPMSMLSVTFDGTALAVVDEATKLGDGVYPVMNYVAPGSYEPGKPWSFLNGGIAISRQLGWDDPTAPHGNGIHVPGALLDSVKAAYGPDALIWIELISQSSGVETYFADGMWGVGGTGNAASGTPLVYTDANGFPIVYADNFYGIFGTGGSPTKWQWDGTMMHNVYVVPAAYITQPNQLFTATYRVYIGDGQGTDLAPSAATTEVWTWKGPAVTPDNVPETLSFSRHTGVAPNTACESNAVTVTGLSVPALISVTDCEYAVSTDSGATWSPWSNSVPPTVANGNQIKLRHISSSAQGTTTTAVVTVGGVAGSFEVTTTDGVPDSFSFTPLTGVDPATVYESDPITISGIDIAATVSISTGASYAISTDNGSTWSAWNYTDATIGPNSLVKVRVTSSPNPDTAVTATLTVGGLSGTFSVTTNAYAAPPSWMPMTMLNISYDGAKNKLAIVAEAPPLPALSQPASAAMFDPAKPWNVLNGKSYSRQLGWNPAAGLNAAAIQAAFGPDASIWIEKLSSSEGLETYLAIGKYGVNVNNSTTVDPAAGVYAPIFGTDGSSTRWKWDYQMDHNVYAVPAAYLTAPNQQFTAQYRIYIGDSQGKNLAPSVATTTTWTWQGPAAVPDNVPDTFTFPSLTGVAPATMLESDPITITGLEVPALISVTGGEYSVSTDSGATWSAWTAVAGTVTAGNQVKLRQTSSAGFGSSTTADLTIGGVSGSFTVTTSGVPIKVPKVTGKSEAKARSTLASKKLSAGDVTRSFSPTVKAGYVISQTPAAGAAAETGTSVDLVISDGPEPVTVPSVVGGNQTEAKAALSAAGLKLKTVTREYSETAPAGEVISQIPAAGESVAPGASVKIVVSSGPAPVKVPKVLRLSEADAGSAITAARLTLGTVTQTYSTSIPAGMVIKQKPSAGASVPPGSAVNVVVSLGRKAAVPK